MLIRELRDTHSSGGAWLNSLVQLALPVRIHSHSVSFVSFDSYNYEHQDEFQRFETVISQVMRSLDIEDTQRVDIHLPYFQSYNFEPWISLSTFSHLILRSALDLSDQEVSFSVAGHYVTQISGGSVSTRAGQ